MTAAFVLPLAPVRKVPPVCDEAVLKRVGGVGKPIWEVRAQRTYLHHGWRELWWWWWGRWLVRRRGHVHRVHEGHPILALRGDGDLVRRPRREGVQIKAGRRCGEREGGGCRSTARRWYVFTRRSLMAQVFGRPVISPLQADDPPCTALFVVHEPMVKVGKSEQVVGCW